MYKRILIVIIFTISCFCINAQKKSLNLSFNYSPVYSNYKFNPITDIVQHQHNYSNKFNYNSGVSLSYLNNNFFAFDIAYSSKGYNLNYKFDIIANNDPLFFNYAEIEAGYVDLNFSYGKVISINKIKLIPNIKFGMSSLINDKIVTVSNNGEKYINHNGEGILFPQDLRKNILSSSLGIKILVVNINNFIICVEPFSSYMFSIIEDESIKTKPIMFGLNFELIYKLKEYED